MCSYIGLFFWNHTPWLANKKMKNNDLWNFLMLLNKWVQGHLILIPNNSGMDKYYLFLCYKPKVETNRRKAAFQGFSLDIERNCRFQKYCKVKGNLNTSISWWQSSIHCFHDRQLYLSKYFQLLLAIYSTQ